MKQPKKVYFLAMMLAFSLVFSATGDSALFLKNWSRGWNEKSGLLHLQVDQETRLQSPISLVNQKIGMMLNVSGGSGNILFGFEREKSVVMTWKMSFGESKFHSEFLGGEEVIVSEPKERSEDWVLLEMEGFGKDLTFSVDGRAIANLKRVNLDGAVYLRIAAEGSFDSIRVDELNQKPLSGAGAGLLPLNSKPSPLPLDWTAVIGNWAVMPFPGEKNGFFTLSSSDEGQLESQMVLQDSMDLKLRCRFEGEGAIGISLSEKGKGQKFKLWLRYHSFGILLEREGEDGMEVLLREGPQVFPGLWNEVDLKYTNGLLSLVFDGLIYELPVSIPSGSSLGFISKGTQGSFFQIIESRGWHHREEATILTDLTVADLGVKAGGNWMETPTLSFAPEENILKVESSEKREWKGMQGIWRPEGAERVFAQVMSGGSPRLDFVKGDEAWWAVTSLIKQDGADKGSEVPENLKSLLGEVFLQLRSVLNAKVVKGDLKWTMRIFGEGREHFLLVSAGGERLGTVPFSDYQQTQWSLGAFGKASLETFRLISGETLERGDLVADGMGFSMFGGGFGSSSLPERGTMTLAEPLLENSKLELSLASPTNWGHWSLDLVDAKGKTIIETYVDLREPPFSLFHLKGNEDGGVVDEPNDRNWEISIFRQKGYLIFSQSGERFGPIQSTTDQPLFLRFSSLEGELEASKISYGWSHGGKSDFRNAQWSKHTMRDWERVPKGVRMASERYESKPVGPIGEIVKKQGLSRFHEVYLKRRPGQKERVGTRHRLSWVSESSRCQVLFLQLDEGMEVELSVNGNSRGKVMVKDRAFSFSARYLPEETSLWLGGEMLFREKAFSAKGWEWTLSPDGKMSKGMWSEVMWRNL